MIFPSFGQPPAVRARRGYGFTLIEILVVVAIIIILAALLVAVGSGVISSSKGRQTHATLHALDALMKQYLSAGNPEPTVPTPWPYPTSQWPYTVPVTSYVSTKDPVSGTTPDSDPINWVKFLKADPTTAKQMNNLTTGTDPFGNTVVLDAWGTPIRYVPYNPTTKKNGYFESAGPDRQFLTTTDPPPAPAKLPPDDLYSTDPM